MRQVQQGIALSGRLLGYDRGYKKLYPSDRAGFAGGASLIRPDLTEKDFMILTGGAESHGLALKERYYGTKALCSCRSEYPDDRRCFAGDRLPHFKAH